MNVRHICAGCKAGFMHLQELCDHTCPQNGGKRANLELSVRAQLELLTLREREVLTQRFPELRWPASFVSAAAIACARCQQHFGTPAELDAHKANHGECETPEEAIAKMADR